ncbi:hypothetical protein [Mycobacterium sp.]|uniref:hypothetical protein n=1 Tax=Mycobacterium sp. TaxID=1785 RepID=UPI0031D30AE8
MAIAPAGSAAVSSFGSWSSGVAWSTIKVPLAIAALRADRSRARDLVVRAITRSDNAAAELLWSQLGLPAQAAQHVQAVLHEGGAMATQVESRRLRTGFTAFGQTRWSIVEQARFAAHLPCLPGADTVIDLMDDLADEQRWGLAACGAPAKGGWGPGEVAGHYLVRQFGLMPARFGGVGVALAAEADDGTFASGVAALNRMAHWLADQLPTKGSRPEGNPAPHSAQH